MLYVVPSLIFHCVVLSERSRRDESLSSSDPLSRAQLAFVAATTNAVKSVPHMF